MNFLKENSAPEINQEPTSLVGTKFSAEKNMLNIDIWAQMLQKYWEML